VEMTEAANILNNATDKSLILMDEIGRGTSTYDGLSLAWAVARHIARVNRSFTLFATHYFELTHLPQEIEGIANVHLDATEHRDGIVFLHAVKDGPASRSYGLAVAQLAGVPRETIAAAREYLAALEKGGAATADAGTSHGPRSRGRIGSHTPQAQLPLEPPPLPPPDPRLLELEAALKAVSADDLTPRAALDLVYKLRALLD
jgi:DNA mismatch repair protein MutS